VFAGPGRGRAGFRCGSRDGRFRARGGRFDSSQRLVGGRGRDRPHWGRAMMQVRFSRWMVAALATLPVAALAADPVRWQLNMGRGVAALAKNGWEAHLVARWIGVGIGAVVFLAMGYDMYRCRRSKGAVPDTSFTHSTRLEILWTVIPVVLLVIMAVPATAKLVAMYDTRESEMTVKVTGLQWMWKYEYLG